MEAWVSLSRLICTVTLARTVTASAPAINTCTCVSGHGGWGKTLWGGGLPSHLTLGGGFACGGPAGVGEGVLGVALRGDGRRGQRGYGGALGRLFLQELLRLAVVQRGAAGLQGHGVRAHAGVKAASRRLDLFQVVPVKLLAGQETHALHDADLLLGVASVHSPLAKRHWSGDSSISPDVLLQCGNGPFISLHTLSSLSSLTIESLP